MNLPRTLVVVSHWTGHSDRHLFSLLKQMLKIDSGTNFDLTIISNGGTETPLELPKRFDRLNAKIVPRENQGFNIGAWNHGWIRFPEYQYYLFLQDECFLKNSGWVAEFEYRMDHDAGLGMLGEAIMWDQQSWSFIRSATDRDLGQNWYEGSIHPVDFYQSELERRGIDKGDIGTHLQTLVLFTSREVLARIGGFPVGDSYQEAIACEVGISRLVSSLDLRISTIKDTRFALIGHSQWTKLNGYKRRLRTAVRGTLPFKLIRQLYK